MPTEETTGDHGGRAGGRTGTGTARTGEQHAMHYRHGRLEGMGLFTVTEARAELARLRPVLDELITLRADAAELGATLSGDGGGSSKLGGRAELKAAQARLDELLTEIQQTGAELKGFAPLLIDFPAELDQESVLLCWLEGDSELEWYHRHDLGFAGRRRIPTDVA